MSDNTMTYKGYSASVEYSGEDGCFIGHIHGIRDIITFEGESVRELRADFKNAVDGYLKHCEKIGKAPEKQVSGKMLLRLPVDLHYQLTVQSEESGQSVNSLVVDAVKSACRRRRTAGPEKAKKPARREKREKQSVSR